MSISSVLSQITNSEVNYGPVVLTAVQMAETVAPEATGAQKAANVIAAVSSVLGAVSDSNVSAISQQVNLAVLLLNLFGVFKQKPLKAATPPPPMASLVVPVIVPTVPAAPTE